MRGQVTRVRSGCPPDCRQSHARKCAKEKKTKQKEKRGRIYIQNGTMLTESNSSSRSSCQSVSWSVDRSVSPEGAINNIKRAEIKAVETAEYSRVAAVGSLQDRKERRTKRGAKK